MSDTEVTAAPALHDQIRRPSLWGNMSFMLMWSSVAASGFGDRLIQLASWPLLGINNDGAQKSSIQASALFFFFLPYIFIGPVGGWLADTLPRKWLMLFCDEARAVVLLAAVLVLSHYAPGYAGEAIPPDHELAGLAIWATYGTLMLTGALAAIFGPTRDATVPQIVELRQLQAANAIILAIATIAALIGVGVGGWIISLYSVRTAIIVGFLSYAISGTFWAFLKPREHKRIYVRQHASQIKRFIQAAGYLKAHRRLLELVGVSLMFWGLSGLVVGAMAALCSDVYGFDKDSMVQAIGMTQAALGSGMLLSSLVLTLFSTLRESQWLIMVGMLGSGLCLLGLWLAPWFAAGLALAFLMGFSSNFIRVGTDTLTQALSANYIRGRVFGLREILTTGCIVIVNFIIWQLPEADAWMIHSLIVLAVLLTVVGVWGLWRELSRGPMPSGLLNALWRIDRAFVFAFHRVRSIGKFNVPHSGKVLLASNHTTGIDPFLIQACLLRRVRWVMLRSYRFRLLEFAWRAIDPVMVDQDGKDLAGIRQVLRALEEENIVGLFPEGGLQRENRDLQAFAPGIGLIAKRSGATIVPVWIAGTPQTRNMLWHFLRPSHAIVAFGEPLIADTTMTNEQVADDLRQRMLRLAEQVDDDV